MTSDTPNDERMIKDARSIKYRSKLTFRLIRKNAAKKQTEKPPQKSLAGAVRSSSHLKRRESDCFLLIFIALYIPSEIPQVGMFSLALERGPRGKSEGEKKIQNSHALTLRRV